MEPGIAILATIAFDAKRDINLRRIDAKRLFPPSTLGIVVRRNTYLRSYMVDFMRLFAPALKKVDVTKAVAGGAPAVPTGALPSL